MIKGVVFWQGISRFTGDDIVAIATGLQGQSHNPKTGPMVQTWVLCRDVPPQEAKRAGLDAAICGDCALRGDHGTDSRCYVPAWRSPSQVWKAYRAGHYPSVTGSDSRALLEGRHVRLCAYGDAAATPFEPWAELLSLTAGYVAYTHAWRTCDPRWKAIAMASVETVEDFAAAQLRGWRTFRIRRAGERLLETSIVRQPLAVERVPLEFACPASDEMGHRTTCQHCQLCRGQASAARSVAIVVHGHNGALAAFHKSRRAAEVLA